MVSKKYFYTLISVLSIVGIVNAQSWDEFEQDMRNSGQIGINLWKSMISPSNEDHKIFLISSAVVVSSAFADQSIREWTKENQTEFGRDLFSIDRVYGDTGYMIGASALMYAGGFFSKDYKLKSMGLQTFQALVYTGILTVVTKEIFGRSRPYTDDGPFHFKPFSFKVSNRSFFSGHTSTVFAFSTVMAYQYDNLIWKTLWYSAAGLTGMARIYNDKHWLSDVIAGALVGYAIGSFVVDDNQRIFNKSVKIAPGINNRNTPILFVSIPLK